MQRIPRENGTTHRHANLNAGQITRISKETIQIEIQMQKTYSG